MDPSHPAAISGISAHTMANSTLRPMSFFLLFLSAPALSPLLQINWSAAWLEKTRGPAGSPARTPILGWLVAQPEAPQAPGCP